MSDEILIRLNAADVQRVIAAALEPMYVAHNRLVERVNEQEQMIEDLASALKATLTGEPLSRPAERRRVGERVDAGGAAGQQQSTLDAVRAITHKVDALHGWEKPDRPRASKTIFGSPVQVRDKDDPVIAGIELRNLTDAGLGGHDDLAST